MRVSIGKPEHGWVQVEIRDKDFTLSDSISDVPRDFIDETIRALTQLLTFGTAQPVELPLEPGAYLLSFGRSADAYTLDIKQSAPKRPTRTVYEASGTFDEIILPVFLAIKNFSDQNHREPHWPSGSDGNLAGLADLISQHT